MVNDALASNLPGDSSASRAIAVLQETLGYTGSVRVMVEEVFPVQAKAIKERLAAVEGVAAVAWLDDFLDLTVPLEA